MDEPASRHADPGAPEPGGPGSFHFSSDALPEHCRVELWREAFGEKMLRIELESLPGHSLRAEWTLRALPGLGIVWATNSPLRITIPRHLIAGGSDNIGFQWAASPRLGNHLGREVTLGRNDAVLLSCCDPGSLAVPSAGPLISMSFPRDALGPLLRDGHAGLGSSLPGRSSALQLLIRYLEILRDDKLTSTLELQHLAVAHVYDLLAVALGATRDAAETAKVRGVRAARLAAIKADVGETLGNPLTAAGVAARHCLTQRQLQRLFSAEGTTFTDYLREQRLVRAHHMLEPALRRPEDQRHRVRLWFRRSLLLQPDIPRPLWRYAVRRTASGYWHPVTAHRFPATGTSA